MGLYINMKLYILMGHDGEALFSTWGYVDNAVSRITIEAMSEAALYCMPKQKLENNILHKIFL